jgi:DNA-binding response OmpR family regulator
LTECILIVEDDTAIGEMLTFAIIQETAYEPLLVSTEQEALRVVEAVKPVLLLLDQQLPDATGIALYDHLHARNELAAIPAIVMSANVPRREVNERHLVGIEKPFDLNGLLQTMQSVLASSREEHPSDELLEGAQYA